MKRNKFLCIIFLLLTWPILGMKVVELPDILKPHLIVADKDQLFIVEDTSILVYSLKDFSLLKKFGKRGEGPGELKQFISGIDIQPDFILVNSIGRLSWFDRSWHFLKQQNDTSMGHNYKIVGKHYAGMKMVREKDAIYFAICIFDSHLKNIREIYRYTHPFFKRKRKINPVNIRVSSYFVFNNKIFVDGGKGIINVYDENGKMLYTINHEFEPIKISKDDKERYIEFWKSDIKAEYKVYKQRLEFPTYFPAIRDFQVANGKIYVLTNKKKDGKNELIIFNLKGKLLKKTMAPLLETNMILPHLFCYYTIQNNRIYKLVDNQDKETWELHITEPLLANK